MSHVTILPPPSPCADATGQIRFPAALTPDVEAAERALAEAVSDESAKAYRRWEYAWQTTATVPVRRCA